MNSLRPLATISLLGIVGLFLYMKINETEPVVPADVADWGNLDQLGNLDIGTDIANIDIGGVNSDSPATATTTAAPYGMAADATDAPAAGFESAPEFSPQPATEAPPAFAPTPDDHLVAAPVAGDRYAQAPPAGTAPVFESAPVATHDTQLPPLSVAAGETDNFSASATTGNPVQGMPPATPPAVASSTAPAPHVVTPADTSAISEPRYPGDDPVAPADPITPTEPRAADSQTATNQGSLFSATRVAVQSALDRGELSQALLLLSDWYGDPSLSPAEATEVQQLLSQLAGSVIYSTEHRLEPPYMVQAGETLEAIAQKHNVPWQLLAKINGLTSPDQVQPGQQLKVIRGPFSARIDLSDRTLVLMLDRRYAGQFPLDIEPKTSVEEGYWSVNQKLLTPGGVGMISSSAETPSEERSILLTSTGGSGQVTVLRGPGSAAPGASTPAERVIKFRGADVEDVYDILSVGSQVIIRR